MDIRKSFFRERMVRLEQAVQLSREGAESLSLVDLIDVQMWH